MVSCESRIAVNTRPQKLFYAWCADSLKQWWVDTADEGWASEQRNVENATRIREDGVQCALKEQGKASEEEKGNSQVDKKGTLDIGGEIMAIGKTSNVSSIFSRLCMQWLLHKYCE